MDNPGDVDDENLTTKNKERMVCTVITCTIECHYLMLYKTSQRKFICKSCTGEVPKKLYEYTNEKNRFSKLSEEIKSLQNNLATKCEESKTLL